LYIGRRMYTRVRRNKWTPHVNRIFFFKRVSIFTTSWNCVRISLYPISKSVRLPMPMYLRINCIYKVSNTTLISEATRNLNTRKFLIYFATGDKPILISVKMEFRKNIFPLRCWEHTKYIIYAQTVLRNARWFEKRKIWSKICLWGFAREQTVIGHGNYLCYLIFNDAYRCTY